LTAVTISAPFRVAAEAQCEYVALAIFERCWALRERVAGEGLRQRVVLFQEALHDQRVFVE
jgi:hypothetical protein